MAGLLNPTQESAVCRKMIDKARENLKNVEDGVLRNVLDERTYLQRMGRIAALREIVAELEKIYEREFNT